MVEIDLEEVKKVTKYAPSRYAELNNVYSWWEYTYRGQLKYLDSPIYDLSSDVVIKNFYQYESGSARYVCFGKYTRDYRIRKYPGSRIRFKITVRRKVEDHLVNNLCWMNPEQLNYWISLLKEELGLRFYHKVEECGNGAYYDIHFDFLELSNTAIKYVLFWTRYAFELPAGYLALDALLLKRDYYPEETVQNLLTLVAVLSNNLQVRMSASQCITTIGKFIKPEILAERLNTYSQVLDIFERIVDRDNRYAINGKVLPQDYCPENRTAESWLGRTGRFKTYQDYYPLFKSQEIGRN